MSRDHNLGDMRETPEEKQIEELKAEVRKIQAFLDSKDMVPRSRLNAVDAELTQAKEALIGVQKVARAELEAILELFQFATGQTPDQYRRMMDKKTVDASMFDGVRGIREIEESDGPSAGECNEFLGKPGHYKP